MGGHGGLNILPQKSWNVYGQRNRQKVAEDEAAEREKQVKTHDQQTRGDRIARVDVLRKQAHAEDSGRIDKCASVEQEHHINFWSQHEAANRNPETEAEKAEQLRKRGDPKTQTSDARFDERFAVLHGHTGQAPWYARHKASMYSDDPIGVDHSRSTELASVHSVMQKSRNMLHHQPQVLRTHTRGEPRELPMQRHAASVHKRSGSALMPPVRQLQHAPERSSGKINREKKHKKEKKRGREKRHSRSRSRSPEPSAGRRSTSRAHRSRRRRHQSHSETHSGGSGGDAGARGQAAAGGAPDTSGFAALRRERLDRERAEAQRSRLLMRDHFGRN